MNSSFAKPRIYDFCFLELDYTLVRVEERDGEVIIRASDDTFTNRRKVNFIHELAAEGFIPDEYRWFTLGEPDYYSRKLRWLVDGSWMKVDTALIARHWKIVRRYLFPAAVLWMALVYFVYPGGAKPASVQAEKAPVVVRVNSGAHALVVHQPES